MKTLFYASFIFCTLANSASCTSAEESMEHAQGHSDCNLVRSDADAMDKFGEALSAFFGQRRAEDVLGDPGPSSASCTSAEESMDHSQEQFKGTYINDEYTNCDPLWYHSNATHKYLEEVLSFFEQKSTGGVLSKRGQGIYDYLRALQPGQWKDSLWQNLDDILSPSGVQLIKDAYIKRMGQ